MATAYTVTLVAAQKNGAKKTMALSSSDVAGEYWLAPSGASDIVLGGADSFITDVIVSSSGGTTKNFAVYIGGTMAIDTMPLANFVGTVYGRPFQSNPLRIPASTPVKFKQLA